MILGIGEAAQDISFPAMAQRMQAAVDVLLKDPDIASVGSNVGPGGPTATLNQGRLFIALKPRDQRRASAIRNHRAACGRSSPRSRALRYTCSRRRTSRSAAV